MLHHLPPLPSIPGGWTTTPIDLGWQHLELIQPKEPDQFLEDPQVLDANRRDDYMPYWSYLWPAAKPFSTLAPSAPWPIGSEVLDLGSGIGLTGVAMLARGDRVVFSDYDEQALLVCRHNAVRNGFNDPETLLLDWRRPVDRRFSVITGCEVTYEPRNQEVILFLLDRMLADDGIAWISEPGRFHVPRFHRLATEAGYRVRILDEELRERPQPLANAFQIMELRRESSESPHS